MTTNDTDVDPREEELLRAGFEQELAAIVSGASPIEGIIDAGRRIHRRRQAAGGTMAVLGAAGLSLVLVVSGALGGTQGTAGPASSGKPTAHTGKHPITVNSAEYDTAHGLVGSGTVDGLAWRVALTDPAKPWAGSNYQIAVGPAGGLSSPGGESMNVPPVLSDDFPLRGLSEWDFENTHKPYPALPIYYVRAGEVPSDTGSVVVDYADGKSATFPVIVEAGKHLVAFVGPAGYDVARISAYSVNGGLIAYSVPYNVTNVSPYMIDATWHRAGQPLPPEGSVTFKGTFEGSPYTLRMTVNATGVCTDFDHGGTDKLEGCDPANAPTTGEDRAGGTTSTGSTFVAYGYADPGVANVKLNLKHIIPTRPDLTLVPSTAKISLNVVSKLGMTFWSAVIPAGEQVVSYTTYDAQGKVIETQFLDG